MAINLAGLPRARLMEMFNECFKKAKSMENRQMIKTVKAIPLNLPLGGRGDEPCTFGMEIPREEIVGWDTDAVFSAAMWLAKEYTQHQWMLYATYDLMGNADGSPPMWTVTLECLEPEPQERTVFDFSAIPTVSSLEAFCRGDVKPSDESVVKKIVPDPDYKRLHVQMSFNRDWYDEKYQDVKDNWELAISSGHLTEDAVAAAQNPVATMAQGIIEEFEEWFSCTPDELEEMMATVPPAEDQPDVDAVMKETIKGVREEGFLEFTPETTFQDKPSKSKKKRKKTKKAKTKKKRRSKK